MSNNKLLLVVAILLMLTAMLQAAENTETTPNALGKIEAIWGVIWNNALTISILFIFLSAIVGFFVKARAVDKCLKDFRYYTLAVENTEGQFVSGKMYLYSSGMELEYARPCKEENFTSYTHVLYKTEYASMRMVYRYADALSPANRKRREKDIRRTYKPGLLRYLLRKFRNMVATFSDAFKQSMGVIMGHIKKVGPSAILKTQGKQLNNIGKDIIGYAGSAYDPILEKYIGRKVVVEISKGDTKERYCGIFKEYTPDFLEILNIQVCQDFAYPLVSCTESDSSPATQNLQPAMQIAREQNELSVQNAGNFPLYLRTAKMGIDEHNIDKLVSELETVKIAAAKSEKLELTIVRQVDIVVPRSIAVIRHVADQHQLHWRDALKFDL